LTQTVPAAHTWPHVPQLLTSVAVFTHVPLHAVWLAGHEVTQTPLVHVVPVVQTTPHAPQLFGSVDVLMQTPLHND
jgi:hypothetical protein